MKISQLVYLSLTVVVFLSFLSCQKENVGPKTPEQLLTANAWKIDEIRYLQNNDPHYYKRGGSQNTESFSDEYIEFFSDNTGKYHSQDLSTVSLTWSFANAEKTIIQYTLPGLPITWGNIILTEGSIRYTEYYTRGGTRSLAEAIRIPK